MNNPDLIVIVGAGGLGTAVGLSLAQFAPRPITVQILDFDRVELSNLNRQVCFFDTDIGRPKAELLAERLGQLYPNSKAKFTGIVKRLEESTATDLLAGSTLVVDATDSASTKLFLNDFCVSTKIPLCHGAAAGTLGQCMLVAPEKGTACIRCVFEDQDAPDPSTENCQAAGILGAFVGLVGQHQALLVCNALTGKYSDSLLYFTSRPLRVRTMTNRPNRNCPIKCSEGSDKDIITYDFRSKRCPETFLYTKLAVESAEIGQKLEIQFANWETTQQVERSLAAEGFQGLQISATHTSTDYYLTVVKEG